MAVFRVERTNNYTVMSNYHLRDKTISFKAKGLLSMMLSLPENWDYTLAGLARISLEGKDAIRAAVVELEKAGYVQRRQTTDKAGKFGSNEYIIREYYLVHLGVADDVLQDKSCSSDDVLNKFLGSHFEALFHDSLSVNKIIVDSPVLPSACSVFFTHTFYR